MVAGACCLEKNFQTHALKRVGKFLDYLDLDMADSNFVDIKIGN